jgi:hypothetical protein
MRRYVLAVPALLSLGSACLDGATHAAKPGHVPKTPAGVRIVLADVRDLPIVTGILVSAHTYFEAIGREMHEAGPDLGEVFARQPRR